MPVDLPLVTAHCACNCSALANLEPAIRHQRTVDLPGSIGTGLHPAARARYRISQAPLPDEHGKGFEIDIDSIRITVSGDLDDAFVEGGPADVARQSFETVAQHGASIACAEAW